MDLNSGLPSEGARLSLHRNLGTVRFVGKVDGTPGIWLGVEWDDPCRGKHDGVKDGKRYFSCRVPNAGSFVRPSASICYGNSFLQSLVSKYIEIPHGLEGQEVFLLGSSKDAIEVEAVGLNKIRGKLADFQKLREVSLDGENVAHCDPPGAIHSTCPNVRGLDLSMSLIPSWDVIALITAELPRLERLSLNRNRLQPFNNDHAASAFLKLTDIQLNGTLMTWREMQKVTALMPSLRLVEFGYNQLTTLSQSESSTPLGTTIQAFNLDSNLCQDWHQICQALEPYTSLQRLILTSNRIDKILPLRDHDAPFPGLKNLSLSFNCLGSWSDVDALSKWCPMLESLSLIGNPVVEDSDTGRFARQFTVARIPSLLTLDGVAISRIERKDYELFYLSYIVKYGPFSEEDRRREHPRWEELCAGYGRPDESAKRTPHEDKLSNRIIQLNLHQGENSEESVFSKHLRVLPAMSLRAFRLKVLKSIPLPSNSSIELWLKMGDGELVQMDSKHDDQDLSWWGVENDSHVFYHIDT